MSASTAVAAAARPKVYGVYVTTVLKPRRTTVGYYPEHLAREVVRLICNEDYIRGLTWQSREVQVSKKQCSGRGLNVIRRLDGNEKARIIAAIFDRQSTSKRAKKVEVESSPLEEEERPCSNVQEDTFVERRRARQYLVEAVSAARGNVQKKYRDAHGNIWISFDCAEQPSICLVTQRGGSDGRAICKNIGSITLQKDNGVKTVAQIQREIEQLVDAELGTNAELIWSSSGGGGGF